MKSLPAEKIVAFLRAQKDGASPSHVESWLFQQNLWVPSRPTLIRYLTSLSKDFPIERRGQGRGTRYYDAIYRIPYMAPNLAGKEKAAKDKTPTDVWWNTIVSPTGKEKTGYPTQKPLALLERIVAVHSNPQDRLLDFFAGSGSFGHAAAKLGRDCVLVDKNPAARSTIIKRFSQAGLPLKEQSPDTPLD